MRSGRWKEDVGRADKGDCPVLRIPDELMRSRSSKIEKRMLPIRLRSSEIEKRMLVGAEKGDCPAHRIADKIEEVAVVES